jgi:hypothetical protein
MAAAKSPAYQRRFTLSRNHSATYFARAFVNPDIEQAYGKAALPRLLRWRQQQLSRAMSAAVQLGRRTQELEVFVKRRLRQARSEHLRLKGTEAPAYPLILAMEPIEYERWQYCREAARRADETASRLEKELFERLRDLRSGEQTDLVAAMAAGDEPIEPEPSTESEG